MESTINKQSVLSQIWSKYNAHILSFILCIFTLPVGFYYTITTSLDASWVRALNMAVKNNTVFGSGIVFTYGPLAYLSTRNTQYIPNLYLLIADIFLCSCFYYLIHNYISKNKGWFALLFVAIFYYKGAEFASCLFIFFIFFAILNLQNKFRSYFEVVCCAVCGVLVFFVKINYGLIAMPIIAAILVYLIIYNRKMFLAFFTVLFLVFNIICLKVNVDIIHYIKYSLPMISGYAEAMQVEIDPNSTPVRSAIILFLLFLFITGLHIKNNWSVRAARLGSIVFSLFILLVFYLAFKNGFTRADGHTFGFFLIMPVLTIFSLFLLGFGDRKWAKAVCIGVIFLSDLNVELPHGSEGQGFLNKVTFFYCRNYFKTMFEKQEDIMDANNLKLPDSKLQEIGNATIDILPIDVSILHLNNLNYYPRPIMQSYSAYKPVLDSLNANHFYKPQRPELAMIKMGFIDNRYVCWDESLTKAVLHLNYDYVDFVSLNNDTALVNSDGCYLLLRSKKGVAKYPKFEKLYEKTISFDDTLQVDFPEQPIYMSADVEYTLAGKLKNILFQAPVLNISMFLDHACTSVLKYQVVRPLMKEPLLISNAIVDNLDFRAFMTGHSNDNAKIKAFAFHANSWGCEQKIKLTFYKFANY